MADYYKADDPEALSVELIDKNHPHLLGLHIAYLFKSVDETAKKKQKQPRMGKKITLAKTSRVSEKSRTLMTAPFQFVIEFSQNRWDELTPEQQLALVDHELAHCGNDADGCYLKSHGLEEFPEIAARHGAWMPDITQFVAAADDAFHAGNVHENAVFANREHAQSVNIAGVE